MAILKNDDVIAGRLAHSSGQHMRDLKRLGMLTGLAGLAGGAWFIVYGDMAVSAAIVSGFLLAIGVIMGGHMVLRSHAKLTPSAELLPPTLPSFVERRRNRLEARRSARKAKNLLINDQSELSQIVHLASSLPMMIIITDERGRITHLNSAAREGLFDEAGLHDSTNIVDLLRPEDRDMVNTMRAQLVSGRGNVPERIDVVLNVENERVGQLTCALSEVKAGQVMFWTFLDRTEHRSLQQQFVQAQKMQAVGQLAGGVAHDFNNLLTAILGFCDLLLSRHDPSDRSFSDLMQIKQNAHRAANLVRQLLAFSRQQTMRPTVLKLSDALGDLSNLLRRLIGSSIELQVIHGRGIQPVLVDQGQLEQVIVNLAVNARDAMPDGGVLTIKTAMVRVTDGDKTFPPVVVPGDYVEISVKDSGHGISEDNLNKIFEPFFTTKSVGQGTGLGLATVYGIVKQMGGYVFAYSPPGEGAEFQVLLKPHAHAAGTGDETPAATKVRDLSGSGTILIVEDEDPVRILVDRALTARGYTVIEAINGEEGWDLFQEHADEIDLLVTDVVMPGLDGPGLASKVRSARKNLPVLFISGYAESIVRQNLEDARNYFLQKPFSLKDMAAKVKEIAEDTKKNKI